MRACLLLSVICVCIWAPAAGAQDTYNSRMAPEEREKITKRIEERRARLQNGEPLCETTSKHRNDDPPFPVLPKSFTTLTEISFIDNNTVITGEEMYDGDIQAGVLKYKLVEGIILTRPHVFQEEIHYSVPLNESLFIFGNNACEDEGSENCHPLKLCFGGNVNDLSEEMKNLLGWSDINPDLGFMGAAGILQWGSQYNYKYKSKESCRAMECDLYETCIQFDDTDDRLYITYYWSIDGWKLNKDGEQVPVAVEIMSSGSMEPVTVRPFYVRYDFYDFLREAKPTIAALQPPKDTYCYGMKDYLEPPSSPNYFAYKSETVTAFDLVVPDGDNQTKNVQFTAVINQEEAYDWDQKIAASKFVPWFLNTTQNRFEHETLRVQDFNQGLHYNVKYRLNNCTIRPIENFTTFGDVIVHEDGSIEMLPPWAYDHLDEPMKYTGEHWVRGIDTDVWIGTKRTIIPFLNESYVWYYASPMMADEEASFSDGVRTDDQKPVNRPFSMDVIPVQFEKYLSLLEALPHHIYNVYSYEDEPPMTHEIDISTCYSDDQMNHHVIDLPSDTLKEVKNLRDKLKYATQKYLAECAGVSPIRINRIVLEERSDCLRVLFSILDKPKVEGDAQGAETESSKEGAAKKIDEALRDGRFSIIVPLLKPVKENAEPDVAVIYPSSKSLTNVKRKSTHQYTINHDRGYSSGSMAGLAFGMLFVGVIVAVLAKFVIEKTRGNSVDLPRVTADKKSSAKTVDTVDLGMIADSVDA